VSYPKPTPIEFFFSYGDIIDKGSKFFLVNTSIQSHFSSSGCIFTKTHVQDGQRAALEILVFSTHIPNEKNCRH
jgi:hypothetical protein